MQFSSDYGTALRTLRQAKGISQMDLELEAGLGFGTVSRIENFRINPTKETLLKIAFVLELSEREILQLLGIKLIPSEGL